MLTPSVHTNLIQANAPRQLQFEAVVQDTAGRILTGSIPLEVVVVDPLGVKRYELLRATAGGGVKLDLQLGVNEPVGKWTVAVRELLSGEQGLATFENRPIAQCGAVAGATRRAVCFPQDEEPIFRFFRTHRNLTLVTGTSDYNRTAAARLSEILKPWGISCQTIAAADVKPKVRPDEAKRTWTGAVGNPDLDLPGDAAIVLGSPEDNPLIKSMTTGQSPGFSLLPYPPAKGSFPGVGKGMIAWQTDAVAFYNYETITLIAGTTRPAWPRRSVRCSSWPAVTSRPPSGYCRSRRQSRRRARPAD